MQIQNTWQIINLENLLPQRTHLHLLSTHSQPTGTHLRLLSTRLLYPLISLQQTLKQTLSISTQKALLSTHLQLLSTHLRCLLISLQQARKQFLSISSSKPLLLQPLLNLPIIPSPTKRQTLMTVSRFRLVQAQLLLYAFQTGKSNRQ